MIKKQELTGKMENKLNATFNDLDNIRREGLTELKTYHQVKRQALTKEYKRMAKKLGSHHQRVLEMENKIRYSNEVEKELDVLILEARMKVEAVDEKTWKIHGKVMDENKKGIKGLTVGLYNERGVWLKELGHDCTDPNGYFSISYSVETEEETAKIQQTKLYLYVLENKKIRYKDDEPVFFTPAEIVYYPISLPKGDGDCPSPEPGPVKPEPVPGRWMVTGTITDEHGKAREGVTVKIFDENREYGDAIRTKTTKKNGEFEIILSKEEYKELFEKKPKIYIKVLDKRDNELHSVKKPLIIKVGKVEKLNIKIKKPIR